jgi:hypothetical protein
VYVRPATLEDLPAVDAMRKADGDALGFVPLQKYEHIVNRTLDRGRPRWVYEWLLVCVDSREITGFVLASFGRAGCKVEQICIRQDARLLERATLLLSTVENEAQKRQSPKIKCRVAIDIEANSFWLALDYRAVATVTSTWLNIRESKSKRTLMHYEKIITQPELFIPMEGEPQ